MRSNALRRLMSVALALAIMLGTFSFAFAQGGDVRVLRTGRQMGPSDLPTLDPSQAQDVPSVQVIDHLFPTLGRLHEEQVIVEPGMATWEVSEDGLVYTFSILPEIPWVHYNMDSGQVEQVMDENGNPRYVTAADFVLGYQRTLDPRLGTEYAGVLAPWVAGGVEFMTSDPEASDEERQALLDGLGVVALDDYTLQFTSTRATPVNEMIFSMWITAAIPGWLLDEAGDFWIEPENIQTYGPYAVKDWVHDESLTMIANPFWPGTDVIPQPTIQEVQFMFLDLDPQLAAFEAGELDVSEVPASAIDRIHADPALSQALHTAYGTCTYYYGFNRTLPLFQDARVVRAFSMAIDRQAIVDNVTRRGEIPAGYFTLPPLNAAPQQADYPGTGIGTDIDGAKALFAEYLAETGQNASDITVTILHNTSNLHASVAQAIQQMWTEALGVNVQIAAQDFGTYLDLRREADVYRAAWCYDYPDANNFMYDVFHSSNDPDNHFNNPEYDALVEQAVVATDLQERRDLYAQAENILVNTDASIAPIYFYTTQDLTQPGIERTYSVITRERYEKWRFTN